MAYIPSKEPLDKQIPQAIKEVKELLKGFQKETGADDRFVWRMMTQLTESLEPKGPGSEGFGFR